MKNEKMKRKKKEYIKKIIVIREKQNFFSYICKCE